MQLYTSPVIHILKYKVDEIDPDQVIPIHRLNSFYELLAIMKLSCDIAVNQTD